MSIEEDLRVHRMGRNGIYGIGLLGGHDTDMTVSTQANIGALFSLGYQGMNGYAGLNTRRANWVWLWQGDIAVLVIGGLNSEVFAGWSVSQGFTSPGFSPGPPTKLMEPAGPDVQVIFLRGQAAIPNFARLHHVIFGHSYGGILALGVAKLLAVITNSVETYTYGCPKPGALGVYDDVPGTLTSYANDGDPINRLPPTIDDVAGGIWGALPSLAIAFRNANEFTAINRKVVLLAPGSIANAVAPPLLTSVLAQQLAGFVELGRWGSFRGDHSWQEYYRRLSEVVVDLENPNVINLFGGNQLGKLVQADLPVPVEQIPIQPGSPNARLRAPVVEQNFILPYASREGREELERAAPVPNVLQPLGPKPRITSLSPASGPQSGSTVVTIRGVNLSAVTEVWFGDAPASEILRSPVQELANTILVATTTPNTPQQVYVRLQWPGGLTPGTRQSQYEFVPRGSASP